MLKRIFDAENPLMQALSVACDLLLLNCFTILCCLPVVTAGAALTALSDVAMHIVRQEGPGVFRMYFRSFRANLKQGILMGLMFLGAAARNCLGFFTTDALSLLFTGVVVWTARRLDGIFEDQKHYLLRIHRTEDGKGGR